MQKVCDIGYASSIHANIYTCMQVQRLTLSCKSKQFILREVEAVVSIHKTLVI